MNFKYEHENKIRLDQFLSKEIDFLSRENIKNLIKKGNVFVDDQNILLPKYILNKDVSITLNLPDESKTNIKKWEEGIMPEIIFENNDYLVINKQSGLTVHPGNGNEDKTLVNILIANNIKLSKIDTYRPGIVHRIDKNTSGVMIIAKNDKFHNYISKEFADGKVNKKYSLITKGRYQSQKGVIDAPIGRDSKNRKLMNVTKLNSKPAKSIFEVKESFRNSEYVEFKILTGRTHQIRVHSKFIGAPVLNDPEYGNDNFNKEFGQYLHAKEISFTDLNNNVVHYKVKEPNQFEEKLQELRQLK